MQPPHSDASRLLLERIRAVDITRERVALAAALGHPSALATGMGIAELPRDLTSEEVEGAFMTVAAEGVSDVAFADAVDSLGVYRRRIEVVLEALDPGERLTCAYTAVAHASMGRGEVVGDAVSLVRRYVEEQVLVPADLGRLEDSLFTVAQRAAEDTTAQGVEADRKSAYAAWAALSLVRACRGAPTAKELAYALDSAAESTVSPPDERSFQAGLLCKFLLRA